MPSPLRICFVCSGNICRSPMAEVVLNHLADKAGMGELVDVDSAGTGSWHAGDDMDERARQILTDHGYPTPRHTARQFRSEDFAARDLVVALDSGHRDILYEAAGGSPDPEAARAKVVLLREFDRQLQPGESADVPDPYYGGRRGFRTVLEQVERGCAGLLGAIGEDAARHSGTAQQTESPPR